jgi:hypothetical protein
MVDTNLLPLFGYFLDNFKPVALILTALYIYVQA